MHLSADAITKRLSDMTDAELAALEQRMITIPGSLALEHVDELQANGDTDAEQDGNGCAGDEAAGKRIFVAVGDLDREGAILGALLFDEIEDCCMA